MILSSGRLIQITIEEIIIIPIVVVRVVVVRVCGHCGGYCGGLREEIIIIPIVVVVVVVVRVCGHCGGRCGGRCGGHCGGLEADSSLIRRLCELQDTVVLDINILDI